MNEKNIININDLKKRFKTPERRSKETFLAFEKLHSKKELRGNELSYIIMHLLGNNHTQCDFTEEETIDYIRSFNIPKLNINEVAKDVYTLTGKELPEKYKTGSIETKEQPTNKELSKPTLQRVVITTQTNQQKSTEKIQNDTLLNKKTEEKSKSESISNPDINIEDIEKTFEILTHKKLEFCSLNMNTGRIVSQWYDTENPISIQLIKQYNNKLNLYVGIHQRRGTLRYSGGVRAKIKDIVKVNTIVIDIDAIREKGFEKQPCTDLELAKCKELTDKVVDFFKRNDKECLPSIAMSGNGYQIWIPIKPIKTSTTTCDLVNSQLHAFYVKLKEKFKEYEHLGKIDNIGDLPRIIKIIGTKSVKGIHTPERPHRLSYWVEYNSRKKESSEITDRIINIDVNLQTLPQPPPDVNIVEQSIRTIEEILSHRKTDKKLDLLLNGDVSEYESNSEGELALSCKLVFYCATPQQIKEILDNSSLPNWKGKTEHYKTLTISKAFDMTSERYNIIKHIHSEISEYHIFKCPDCEYLFTAEDLYKDGKNSTSQKQYACPECRYNRKREHPFIFNETDINNAITDYLFNKYTLKTYEGTQDILMYQSHGIHKGVYIKADTFLRKEFSIFDKISDKGTNSKIIDKLVNRTLTPRKEFNPTHLIPLGNCVLDINTWERVSHSPEHLLTNKIFIEWDGWDSNNWNKELPQPKFDKFLYSITWKKEDFKEDIDEDKIRIGETSRLMLREYLAYVLYPKNIFPYALILVGNGRNGKGCFNEICRHYLGEEIFPPEHTDSLFYPTTAQEIKTMNKFGMWKLYNKWALIHDELGLNKFEDDNMIKAVCDGKYITGADKYKSEFGFPPRCKPLWNCNDTPDIPENASAMFTRLFLVELPFKFQRGWENLKDEEGISLYRKPEEKVAENIYNDKIEMKAILHNSIILLRKIIEKGHLTDFDYKYKKKKYCEYNDSVLWGVHKLVVEKDGFFLGKQELLREWKKLCEFYDKKTIPDIAFFKRVKEKFINYHDTFIEDKYGNRTYGWYGLAWNPEHLGFGSTPAERLKKMNECNPNKSEGYDSNNHYKKLA